MKVKQSLAGMSKFGYLNKKQGHFKLTMLCLFIYILIYYVWALVDIRQDIKHSIQRHLATVASSFIPMIAGRGKAS